MSNTLPNMHSIKSLAVKLLQMVMVHQILTSVTSTGLHFPVAAVHLHMTSIAHLNLVWTHLVLDLWTSFGCVCYANASHVLALVFVHATGIHVKCFIVLKNSAIASNSPTIIVTTSPEKDQSPRNAGAEGPRRRRMKPYLPHFFPCSVSLMPQTLMVLWGGSKLSVLG